MIEKKAGRMAGLFFVPFVRLKIPLTAENTPNYYKSFPHARNASNLGYSTCRLEEGRALRMGSDAFVLGSGRVLF